MTKVKPLLDPELFKAIFIAPKYRLTLTTKPAAQLVTFPNRNTINAITCHLSVKECIICEKRWGYDLYRCLEMREKKYFQICYKLGGGGNNKRKPKSPDPDKLLIISLMKPTGIDTGYFDLESVVEQKAEEAYCPLCEALSMGVCREDNAKVECRLTVPQEQIKLAKQTKAEREAAIAKSEEILADLELEEDD